MSFNVDLADTTEIDAWNLFNQSNSVAQCPAGYIMTGIGATNGGGSGNIEVVTCARPRISGLPTVIYADSNANVFQRQFRQGGLPQSLND